MEEAFPYRFTSGIRAYWRRRKYQRLELATAGTRPVPVCRLGPGFRSFRLRPMFVLRFRPRIPSPARLLAQLRDAYVNAMLGLGRKRAGLMPGTGALWARRVPKSRKARPGPGDYDWKLALEVYESLVASGRITE